jgi:hypothetical protein
MFRLLTRFRNFTISKPKLPYPASRKHHPRSPAPGDARKTAQKLASAIEMNGFYALRPRDARKTVQKLASLDYYGNRGKEEGSR